MIVIITDFGCNEIYTPIMKGIIKSINQKADIIDLSNNVVPQNIKQAAFLLGKSYKHFPQNTTFLCVVDPGVGSERKPIAVKTKKYNFVAPDNGLLTHILENEEITEAIELSKEKYLREEISNTFHGRDIFAPVAGYIDSGIEFSNIGNMIDKNNLRKIKICPGVDENEINGEILYIDRFGNAISNIHQSIIKPEKFKVTVKQNIFFSEVKSTFSDVEEGDSLSYFGSSGHLEFGTRNSNFAKENNVKLNDNVKINF